MEYGMEYGKSVLESLDLLQCREKIYIKLFIFARTLFKFNSIQ